MIVGDDERLAPLTQKFRCGQVNGVEGAELVRPQLSSTVEDPMPQAHQLDPG